MIDVYGIYLIPNLVVKNILVCLIFFRWGNVSISRLGKMTNITFVK